MGLHGITVELIEKTKIGVDNYNAPVYEETPVKVENVIVAPTTADEQKEDLELYNRRTVYTLGIPKVDKHTWEGQKVKFCGDTYQVIGIPAKGIDDLIPGPWNKKVRVARYE